METVHDLSAGKEVSEAQLELISQLPDKSGQFYTVLHQSLMRLEGDPILSMLDLKLDDNETVTDIFKCSDSSKVVT